MEAAFQAAGLHLMTQQGKIVLPIGFSHLEFLESPKDNEQLLVGVVRRGELYDIDVDSENAAILRLRGLKFFPLGPLPQNKLFQPPASGWGESAPMDVESTTPSPNAFGKIEMESLLNRGSIKRQQDRLAGRTAVKKLIHRLLQIPMQKTIVLNNKWGQPFVKGNPQLCVSISHSEGKGYACVKHDSWIGIDVEKIALRTPAFLKTFFTKQELAICGQNPAKQTAIWTIKEAVSKALGLGFHLSTKDIEVISLHPFSAQVKLFSRALEQLSQYRNGEIQIGLRYRRGSVLAIVCIQKYPSYELSYIRT